MNKSRFCSFLCLQACIIACLLSVPLIASAQQVKTNFKPDANVFQIKAVDKVSTPLPVTSFCTRSDSGDLAEHMTRSLNAKIELVTDTQNARSIWSSRASTLSGQFVRNPKLWTSLSKDPGTVPLNISGVSPLNIHPTIPGHGYQKSGTLISPRHVVFATHYPVTTGAKMIFVALDGTSHERTLIDKRSIPESDITIGVLDRDLPPTVAIYEVLDYDSYAPKIRLVNGKAPEILMLSLNQNGQVFLHALRRVSWMGLNTDGSVKAQFGHSELYTPVGGEAPIPNVTLTPTRLALTGLIGNGDSGHPNFVVIKNRFVLVGLHKSRDSGDMPGSRATAINAAMKELGGDYRLKIVDLGCFTSY